MSYYTFQIMEMEEKKLQNIELDILKDFIKICELLKLKYYIVGGTCLGAVRHEGFIPWDDDIDVGMPRKDYDFFLKEGQKYLKKNYFLQTYATDPEYPNAFAKIRNSHTTFIELSAEKFNMNHGVYIDVFPLDGVPIEKNMSESFRLHKLFYESANKLQFPVCKDSKHKMIKPFISHLIKMFINLSKTVIKSDEYYRQFEYDLSEYVGNNTEPGAGNGTMLRSIYGDGRKGLFEGVEVNMPEKTEEYLTNVYGDYMQFPPIEEQIAHHYVKKIDLDKPFTLYSNLYGKQNTNEKIKY